MAKKMNGYTAWIMVGLVIFGTVAGGIVWAVRQEGKVNKNTSDIIELRSDYKEDVGEIKDNIKIILEKL